MEAELAAKFGQNPALKEFLLHTKDKQIIEANAYNTYWSCGWPLSSANIWDANSWRGKRVLGNILQKIRRTMWDSLADLDQSINKQY